MKSALYAIAEVLACLMGFVAIPVIFALILVAFGAGQ